MTLKKYLTNGGSSIPRGAVSRLSEFLGGTWHRAFALAHGVKKPTPQEKILLETFVTRGEKFSAKKPGPQRPKKISSL